MSAIVFLSLRALHVLVAAMWIGSAVFVSFLLMPAIAQSGPSAGPLMTALERRGMGRVIGIFAAITVLSGIYLYWRFTGGFDPEVSRSRAGLAFGIGGAAGILAGVIGGAVVGRGSNELMQVSGRATGLGEGPERAAAFQKMGALQRRVVAASRIVIVLQVIALVLMAVGHYI